MVITEARFDIGDRNTTLCLLENDLAPASPLGLGTQDGYEKIYDSIHHNVGQPYQELSRTNSAGAILKTLSPCYGKEKYWRRYLRTDPRPALVWDDILPIESTLTRRIELIATPGFTAKASLIPRIFLYPFGWSTRLSVRVTGEYSLDDLATLVKYAFTEAAFKIESENRALSLQDLFDYISKGVQQDAFLEANTGARNAAQLARVVTVLAKHGGSPSLRALSPADDASIRKLLRPDGQGKQNPLTKISQKLRTPEELNYILFSGLGRFIWMESLLKPEERNRQHLICYHQNSFRTLLHGSHLEGLLEAYVRRGKTAARLTKFAKSAMEILDDTERFNNASLKALLEHRSTQLNTYRDALSDRDEP